MTDSNAHFMLEKELASVSEKKRLAIESMQFEIAAECRDRERVLQRRLAAFKNARGQVVSPNGTILGSGQGIETR